MPVVYAVRHVMSKPLMTVEGDTSAQEAIKLMVAKDIGALVATETMIDKKIRRLLVTEDEKIIGIVTQKDLMRGTLEAFHSLDSALSML